MADPVRAPGAAGRPPWPVAGGAGVQSLYVETCSGAATRAGASGSCRGSFHHGSGSAGGSAAPSSAPTGAGLVVCIQAAGASAARGRASCADPSAWLVISGIAAGTAAVPTAGSHQDTRSGCRVSVSDRTSTAAAIGAWRSRPAITGPNTRSQVAHRVRPASAGAPQLSHRVSREAGLAGAAHSAAAIAAGAGALSGSEGSTGTGSTSRSGWPHATQNRYPWIRLDSQSWQDIGKPRVRLRQEPTRPSRKIAASAHRVSRRFAAPGSLCATRGETARKRRRAGHDGCRAARPGLGRA
jgi:hypothetical protein